MFVSDTMHVKWYANNVWCQGFWIQEKVWVYCMTGLGRAWDKELYLNLMKLESENL